MALITAVSVLSILFDIVKGATLGNDKINCRSKGEKSPSGPTKMHKDLKSFRLHSITPTFTFSRTSLG